MPDATPARTLAHLLPAGANFNKHEGTASLDNVDFTVPGTGDEYPSFEMRFPMFVVLEPFRDDSRKTKKLILETLTKAGIKVPSPYSIPLISEQTAMEEWFQQECLTAIEDKVTVRASGTVIVRTSMAENDRLLMRLVFRFMPTGRN